MSLLQEDIVNVFNALFDIDARSFHLDNGAILILLSKSAEAKGIRDYKPISLIHSFGKLVSGRHLHRRLTRRQG